LPDLVLDHRIGTAAHVRQGLQGQLTAYSDGQLRMPPQRDSPLAASNVALRQRDLGSGRGDPDPVAGLLGIEYELIAAVGVQGRHKGIRQPFSHRLLT
jgi:hypothetical protein